MHLVVDDDPQMLRYVRDALSEAGYSPVVTGDPEEVSHLVKTEQPGVGLAGPDAARDRWHRVDAACPPDGRSAGHLLSGYGRDETIARALEAGAADYIVKPFSPTELAARVQAALRRRAEPEPFLLGELAINYEQRRVTVAAVRYS